MFDPKVLDTAVATTLNIDSRINGKNEEQLPQPTVGRLLTNSRLTVGRQSANCWPTVVSLVFVTSETSLVKALLKFKRQQLPLTAHCARKRHVTPEAFPARLL